jgi:hypothetical protein
MIPIGTAPSNPPELERGELLFYLYGHCRAFTYSPEWRNTFLLPISMDHEDRPSDRKLAVGTPDRTPSAMSQLSCILHGSSHPIGLPLLQQAQKETVFLHVDHDFQRLKKHDQLCLQGTCGFGALSYSSPSRMLKRTCKNRRRRRGNKEEAMMERYNIRLRTKVHTSQSSCPEERLCWLNRHARPRMPSSCMQDADCPDDVPTIHSSSVLFSLSHRWTRYRLSQGCFCLPPQRASDFIHTPANL